VLSTYFLLWKYQRENMGLSRYLDSVVFFVVCGLS